VREADASGPSAPARNAGAELAALTELLERVLAPVLGHSVRCQLRGPLHVRTNSRIFRAECSGPAPGLAVKLCLDRTGGPDGRSAAEQFRSLEGVYGAMRDGPFRVPRPYALDGERGLVVTEWVDGRPMTELLRSARCSVAEASRLAAAAGGWLQRFHATRGLAPGPLDIGHKLGQLEGLENSAIGPRAEVRDALAILRLRAAEAGEPMLPRSWLHGDFKSDNLLCGSDAVVGIDVNARRENAVLYDLAPFINHLQLLGCDPRAWRWARASGEVQRAFLAAYFDGAPTPRLPLLWMRLFLLLSVWDLMSRAWAGRGLKTRLGNYCFQRGVRRLGALLQAA